MTKLFQTIWTFGHAGLPFFRSDNIAIPDSIG